MVDEELVSARRPRDVLDAAGTWIGDALAADGFGWLRAVRSVQRQAGGVVQQIFREIGLDARICREARATQSAAEPAQVPSVRDCERPIKVQRFGLAARRRQG
ncbi:hypothetical protein [Micromonospora sp. NPDC005205]|uniref:hypothetical protein n=1 Tax=Micromonospora sp. NPDC005205 TaxID=3156714 RepID=UPI0033BD9978